MKASHQILLGLVICLAFWVRVTAISAKRSVPEATPSAPTPAVASAPAPPTAVPTHPAPKSAPLPLHAPVAVAPAPPPSHALSVNEYRLAPSDHHGLIQIDGPNGPILGLPLLIRPTPCPADVASSPTRPTCVKFPNGTVVVGSEDLMQQLPPSYRFVAPPGGTPHH